MPSAEKAELTGTEPLCREGTCTRAERKLQRVRACAHTRVSRPGRPSDDPSSSPCEEGAASGTAWTPGLTSCAAQRSRVSGWAGRRPAVLPLGPGRSCRTTDPAERLRLSSPLPPARPRPAPQRPVSKAKAGAHPWPPGVPTSSVARGPARGEGVLAAAPAGPCYTSPGPRAPGSGAEVTMSVSRAPCAPGGSPGPTSPLSLMLCNLQSREPSSRN